MTAREQLAQFAAGSKNLGALCREYKKAGAAVHLEELVGGALPFYASAVVARCGGVHVFVAEDRDAAAYLLNDFYNLLDEERVCFFPSSYKHSAANGVEDPQGVVQRTATMNALRGFAGKGYLVVCTYPEALAERIVDAEALNRGTIAVRVGDRISIEVLEQELVEAAFTRVDFVYEPGQYSVRGGIVDVFSFSESKPYRLDFFGDEVDSIRRFNISSQLSADKLERVEIIPDLNTAVQSAARVSLARFAGADAAFWFYDADYVLRRVNDVRRRTLADMEQPERIDSLLTSRNGLLSDLAASRLFLLRDNVAERPATAKVTFSTSPQPKFNKNFEMLADDMIRNALRGYDTYILSENKAQVERLENIFHQIGRGQAVVRAVATTLHEGFVDNDLKLCLYTDHQIFDRYQRYRINGEIRRDEQMTVAELNQLRPGDYVVHIDHGVGRFDGLVKINENGKTHEAIKLVYKDGDVLFVNVHSLHRISRYKSGDGEPPKVYKLGTGASRTPRRRPSRTSRASSSPSMPSARRRRVLPSRPTATSSTSSRRRSAGRTLPTSRRPRPPSSGTWSRTSRWTVWSAATWVSARPRWRSAPPSRPRPTASRWPCWSRRRSSPCSTTARSPSACAIFPCGSSTSTVRRAAGRWRRSARIWQPGGSIS